MVIYSQRLAGYLMMNGFVLKGMERIKHGERLRNSFLFSESEEIKQMISQYKKSN